MEKKKLLLGLAPTRRFVFSAEDAARYKVLVEQKLKCWDIEFVNIDPVNKEGLLYDRAHAAAAADLFKKANVDAVFVPHVNFGTEEVVCQFAKAVGKPLLIWGPRDEAPLPDGSRLRDTQCGMFATANVLKKYGVTFSWIVNSRLDTPVFENGMKTFLSAVAAAKAFLGARIGQVSTRPPNFYTVMINEQDLIRKWGIEMVPIDLVVLTKRVLEMVDADPRVKGEAESMRKRVTLKGVNQQALARIAALKLFLADWAEKENLDAIAFKCHDDLPDALGIYPCFVNGELATMGVPVTCETDVHGALTALMLHAAARGATPPFFADLTVRHPTNDNAELLWHCGNFPHSLVKEPNASFLGTHFVIPPHRPGTGNFEIRGGDVTIARFDGIEGEYSLLMGHGRGIDGPFTLGTYLWVEVPDWPMWEERIVRGPYIHHVAGIHGSYAPALYEATRYIPGLKPDPVQPTAEQIGARAVEQALDSPLLNDNTIEGARYILLNITSGDTEITMDEMGEINEYVQDQAGQTAEIILGQGTDESLGEQIGVTIIATGFKTKSEQVVEKKSSDKKIYQLHDDQPASNVPQPEHAKHVEPSAISQAPIDLKPELEPQLKSKAVVALPGAEEIKPPVEYELPDLESHITETDLFAVLEPAVIKRELPLEPKTFLFDFPVSKSEEKEIEPLAPSPSLVAEVNNQYPAQPSGHITTSFPMPTPAPVQPSVPVQAPVAPVFVTETVKEHHTEISKPEQVADDPFQRSRERIMKLRDLSYKMNSPAGISDLEKEPAYKRRNIKLDNVTPSSESEISRYSLTDDNNKTEIKSNNSFLHDRVD